MPTEYELPPTADENERLLESETEAGGDNEGEGSSSQLTIVDPAQTDVTVPPDPRFHQPTPSPFKRAALLIFVGLLFWLAFSLRRNVWRNKSPKVIHAQRYSKEFKFRPAASPVLTETLKDGRIRLRGAQPTGSSVEQPTAAVKKKKSKHGRKKKQTQRRK